MDRRLRRGEAIAIVVVFLAIVAITLWPTHVDAPVDGALLRVLAWMHRLGAPGWIDYEFVEFSANVVMFVPLGALVASMLTPKLWWAGGLAGATLSLCVEFWQTVALPGRTGSFGDVLANTIGAVLGAVVALAARRVHRTTTPSERQRVPDTNRPSTGGRPRG